MKMRVIIVEPLLKNQSGHQFFYTSALKSELENRGVPVFIFGNISARQECLGIKNFFPVFRDITTSFFRDRFLLFNTPVFLKKFYVFTKQLRDCFFSNTLFKLREGDLIFFHTLYIFEFLSAALFLRAKRSIFIRNKCRIVFGLNFRYIRKAFFLTLILGCIYKLICNFLLGPLGANVTFCCDGPALKEEYEKLIKRKVVLFPMPIFPITAPQREAPKKGRLTIAYLGGARYNKGFDLFINLILRLVKDKIFSKFFFTVQIDAHNLQPSSEFRAISRYIRKIEEAAEANHDIRLIHSHLSPEEYYGLLMESDILVLPYRADTYKSVPSNIFFESIIAGKVPLVASGTSMASTLLPYNLGELIFTAGSLESMVNTVNSVVDNYEAYRQKLGQLQLEASSYHSRNNLAGLLLSM